MSGWTPGPWEREGRTVYALVPHPRPGRYMPKMVNRFSCGVQSARQPHEAQDAELTANARLIAAAPMLYAALDELLGYTLEMIGPGNEHAQQARVALAAARGEDEQ